MGSILTSLNAEWRRLNRNPCTRRTLVRWGSQYPALSGLRDLDALLVRRSTDTAGSAGVLAALAELAPRDDLAARALLHSMLPGLVGLARSSGNDDENALDEIVSLAWERIRTYPRHRRGSVAANVLWDVRKRYRQHRCVEVPSSLSVDADSVFSPVVLARSAEEEALNQVCITSLVAAYRRGVVTGAAFELIIRTRFVGVPMVQIAREQRTSPHVLAQRRWRAERVLQRELPLAG